MPTNTQNCDNERVDAEPRARTQAQAQARLRADLANQIALLCQAGHAGDNLCDRCVTAAATINTIIDTTARKIRDQQHPRTT